jgi:hypothetical protein
MDNVQDCDSYMDLSGLEYGSWRTFMNTKHLTPEVGLCLTEFVCVTLILSVLRYSFCRLK